VSETPPKSTFGGVLRLGAYDVLEWIGMTSDGLAYSEVWNVAERRLKRPLIGVSPSAAMVCIVCWFG